VTKSVLSGAIPSFLVLLAAVSVEVLEEVQFDNIRSHDSLHFRRYWLSEEEEGEEKDLTFILLLLLFLFR
jgi:hypothetical protein|tara:strand:+ start:682 stop:891 length:210 start_codon:yes stop_codon:yes gene_type:complete